MLHGNRLFAGPTFMGMRINVSPCATHEVEDWSGCRSPARARRRRAMGYPQRVRMERRPCFYKVGETLIVHPELMIKLQKDFHQSHDLSVLREPLPEIDFNYQRMPERDAITTDYLRGIMRTLGLR